MQQLKIFFLAGATIAATLFTSGQASAQWWNPFEPKDYEDCADKAAKTAVSNNALAILLQTCRSKFKGRRNPGGGYSIAVYDGEYGGKCNIAGPNPTREELYHCNALVSKKANEARSRWAQAKQLVRTRDAVIRCDDQWCVIKYGSVTVANDSIEVIEGFGIGWVILPPNSRAKCPTSYLAKEFFTLELQPGETTTVNFHPTDYRMNGFSYCVGLANIKLDGGHQY